MRVVAIVAAAMLAAGCAAPSTPVAVPSGPLTAIPDRMRLSHHGEPGWTRSDDAQSVVSFAGMAFGK